MPGTLLSSLRFRGALGNVFIVPPWKSARGRQLIRKEYSERSKSPVSKMPTERRLSVRLK